MLTKTHVKPLAEYINVKIWDVLNNNNWVSNIQSPAMQNSDNF